jgi:hypothetical protein
LVQEEWMENDLRLMVLSVAVSSLIRRSGITANELKADLAEYLRALPPEAGKLSQPAIDFCMTSLAGMCSGPDDTPLDS